MKLLALVLSTVAGYGETAKRAVHCLRNHHRMIPMTDGPVCSICGTFWPWFD